jgi:hypothetical protein
VVVGICVEGRSVDVTTCTFKLLSRNVIAEVYVTLELLVLSAAAVSEGQHELRYTRYEVTFKLIVSQLQSRILTEDLGSW